MPDRPDGPALLEEARRLLLEALLPLLPPERHYEGLMIANAMAIAARESHQGEANLRHLAAALAALFGTPGSPAGESIARLRQDLAELEGRLGQEIRAGSYDRAGSRREAVKRYLRLSVTTRLRVSKPKALST